ncbi:MAG: hypothetical protein ACR2GY_06935, partial [Phycisphaerales bacterium]
KVNRIEHEAALRGVSSHGTLFAPSPSAVARFFMILVVLQRPARAIAFDSASVEFTIIRTGTSAAQ